MRLTVDNKRKQWIYLALIIASIGGMLWLWLGSGSPSVDTGAIQQALNATPAPDLPISSTLPLGSNFDLNVLRNQKYLELTPSKKLELNPDEIGRSNPFVPPDQDISQPEQK
ncbi:MAG: hypothetical protein A2722_04190 [Candidatus Doudnabacteria bacterium RIFCSPHIGHO2_01_FULL_50_11]|uniref:Uncharacterized protein n=1 Tax=Candidatus Doudnabacteria bacterium RIFCSPHIGHO2_01_FULL_50_11 TaxID=1817828 RepID=A0A1F5PFA4_9BACT|nr:MAG: hypothetical protein A2722_04190 [Candidatus Doudnabacteria bacterium RIFCSPHIGHO2_01_FULL_50_11]HLC44885.1 hypothetical protein [Patescibacteria group bacterium]